MLIEEYVNGADLQISRIERTRKLIRKTLFSRQSLMNINRTTNRKRHLRIFCDAHFYFICIGQVNRCFKRLCTKLKDKNLNKIYSEFQKVFDQEIRNDLEHVDARAVGLKKKGRREVSIGMGKCVSSCQPMKASPIFSGFWRKKIHSEGISCRFKKVSDAHVP